MIRSLRWRLVLATVLITLAASALVGLGLGRFTRSEFAQFLEVEAEVETAELPDPGGLIPGLMSGDREQLMRGLHRLQAQAEGSRLIVFGPDGQLVADTDPELGEATLYNDGRLEVTRLQETAKGRREERMAIRGGVPLDGPGGPLGQLFVLPSVPREAAAVPPEVGFVRRIGAAQALGVVVAAGLAFALALLLSGQILGPVERLTRAARRLEAGDLAQRVDVRSSDEIGELAGAFNAMAASLERQETLRRDMVGDIAHELRTPLTHLRCRLEAAQDGLVPADSDWVGDLRDEVLHLGRLVDDLQELALAEAGKLPLYLDDVDAAALTRQLLSTLPPEGAPIALEADDPLPTVRVDADRLRQVLRNLLQNALKHGGEEGVAVRLLQTDDAVRFEVRDQGPGVTEDQRHRVFDRFYRTDASRQRSTGGAGLGLAIARQLVLAWGGTIGVDSEPGHGACFWFTVPTPASTV